MQIGLEVNITGFIEPCPTFFKLFFHFKMLQEPCYFLGFPSLEAATKLKYDLFAALVGPIKWGYRGEIPEISKPLKYIIECWDTEWTYRHLFQAKKITVVVTLTEQFLSTCLGWRGGNGLVKLNSSIWFGPANLAVLASHTATRIIDNNITALVLPALLQIKA